MLIEGEARLEPAKTGKPSRPLWFGPAISPPIAVQVQASRVVSARISQGGHVVQRLEETLSPKMRASEIETLVVDLAREILGTGPTCGVGLAWPAVWDHADGTVLSCTPIPALNGSTLLPQLTAALDARVFPQDDARALALGQQWFGEARGTRNLAALQISAGIGAGVVIDGRAFAADGQFPEVGHMCVQLDGALCACGRRGCWETVGSLEWLRRQAGRLNWPNSESATPGDFVRAPGPAAAKVLEEYARNIAVGLVNMATCLGVRRFLLHGEVVTGGQRLEAMVRDRVARGACLPGTPDIQVDFSKLNQEAGLLGAAALPLAHAIEGV
jgi:predicted NBD/HSP70 family sugar kinase